MKTAITWCVLMSMVFPVQAGTWRDDFEDGNLGGWEIDQEFGQIETKDGMVVIADPAQSNPQCLLYFNDGQEIRDFSLKVDARMVRQIENNPEDFMDILARVDENAQVCTWIFFMPNGKVSPMLWTWNQDPRVITSRDFPFPLQLNRWYQIQVDMNGTDISVSVDGQQIAQVDWAGWPILPAKGKVGFGAGGCEAHFDNFVITGDEVPDAGPSGFAVISTGKLAHTWGEIRRGR